MSPLQIRLFGKLAIYQDGLLLSDPSAKALELLCYLLLYRDAAHTREALSDVLWPDVPPAMSKKYLRQTLWQAQAAWDKPEGRDSGDCGLFILDTGWIRINPDFAWWLDVRDFEQAYMRCCDIPDQHITELQAHTLEVAVELYKGDLLETWYQDWCLFERERLQLMYLAMLEKLMGYCQAQQLYTKGVVYGQTILRYDRAREHTHRQLMRLYYLAGNRTGALHQFDRCAAAMVKAFNLEPSQETMILYQHIRADQREHITRQTPIEQSSSTSDADLLLDLHKRLDQIQSGLDTIRSLVQQEFSAIRWALNNDPKTP